MSARVWRGGFMLIYFYVRNSVPNFMLETLELYTYIYIYIVRPSSRVRPVVAIRPLSVRPVVVVVRPLSVRPVVRLIITYKINSNKASSRMYNIVFLDWKQKKCGHIYLYIFIFIGIWTRGELNVANKRVTGRGH